MELQNYSFVISRTLAFPACLHRDRRGQFCFGFFVLKGGSGQANVRFHTIYSGLEPQDHAPRQIR
jgi:hypothetical protein